MTSPTNEHKEKGSPIDGASPYSGELDVFGLSMACKLKAAPESSRSTVRSKG